MVFSESAAMKHFGSVNVVGEFFEMEGSKYQVTGVMKDAPNNSRLQFDFVAPLSDLGWAREEKWSNRSYYTYILLAEGVEEESFFQKVEATVAEAYGTRPAARMVYTSTFSDWMRFTCRKSGSWIMSR